MSESVRKRAEELGGEELICVGALDELKAKGDDGRRRRRVSAARRA